MVSLHITAIGYLVGRHTAAEAYELLKEHEYLSDRGLSERDAVISLIEQKRAAFPARPAPGQEGWRDIDQALEQAGYLSPKGLSDGRRSVTRDGREV
jgi:hypothetical protein